MPVLELMKCISVEGKDSPFKVGSSYLMDRVSGTIAAAGQNFPMQKDDVVKGYTYTAKFKSL